MARSRLGIRLHSGIILIILVFALFFSLLYYASIVDFHSTTQPRISTQEAIRTAKLEPSKNNWFFNTSSATTFYLLDFKQTSYIEESQFIQDRHPLPLVLIMTNGTIIDMNGQTKDLLASCLQDLGFGWCEYLHSFGKRLDSPNEHLAFLVGLEWTGHTELFVLDAVRGTLLDSTIYTRPLLDLQDVRNELQQIGAPRLTQEQALERVEHDLRARHPAEFEKITHLVYNQHSYMPIEEFVRRGAELPLIYIHPSGTLVFVNGTNIEMGYYCDSGTYTFCGFAEPFCLNSKNRLVYGIELAWNPGIPDSYVVDSITGEIVDSGSLRADVRNRKS